MDHCSCRLTVLFEDPFWVGIYEREEEGRRQACRIVFGSQPKDGQVLQMLLENWRKLRFSPWVEGEEPPAPRSPKSLRRQVRRQMEEGRPFRGTKAQQALALGREEQKLRKKERSREEREREGQERFRRRQEKRRARRGGISPLSHPPAAAFSQGSVFG